MKNLQDKHNSVDSKPFGTKIIASPTSSELRTRDITLTPAQDSGRSSVLLIEDDPIVLDLLQDVLKSSGYKVIIAKTGPDGLEMFTRHVKTTLCVVLDYGIPGMHASRLFEKMQEINSEVQVILSSGYPRSFISEDFPVEKLAGFMAKPFDPLVLISELNALNKMD